jgi:ankyrin repeat protein
MGRKEEDLVFYLRKHKNEEAKQLIKELGVNCVLKSGTALNYAILYDNDAIFDFLIDEGNVDVNHLYDKKISPLMSAAKVSNYHMCEVLLKKHADIHYADPFGNS